MKNNLLLSCAGRRVELLSIWKRTCLERLLDAEIIAADAQPFAPAFLLAPRQLLLPRLDTPAYIDHLLDACKKNDIRWIVPTIDTELTILSKNKRKFDEIGTTVFVSDEETIRIAADKRLSHAWFVQNHFPTFEQDTIDNVLQNPDWRYPCFVKPANGSRSVGAARINTREDLIARQKKGATNDIVESLGTGVEVTVDAYVSLLTGKCLCAVPRQRLEVRDGEVSKAKTIDAPEIIELVKKVAETLPGARGPLCIQLFWNPQTKEIRLMEINPRFGGGYPLTDAAGAHFTHALIDESNGKEAHIRTDWTRGLVMLRYDQSLFMRG